MENVEKKAAKVVEPDFTLKVNGSRDGSIAFEIGLRDIDEQTFLAAHKLLKADKELEMIKFLIRQLRVSGDSAEDFCNNFHAVRAATKPIMEIITPLDGELKKK